MKITKRRVTWITSVVTLALCTPSVSPAQVAEETRNDPVLPTLYFADIDHSSVAFTVLHLGITRVRGLFNRWAAALTSDEDLSRSSQTVVIDLASVDTNSDRRDADLRSDNFFDVERYPTAIFQSTDVQRTADGYQLVGRLRLKNHVRPVTIPVTSLGERVTERSLRLGFEGVVTLLREDFGIVNEGNILERVGAIGEDVEVEIQLSALHLKPEGRRYRHSEERPSIGAVLEESLNRDGLNAARARLRRVLEEKDSSFELGVSELGTLGSRLVLEGRAAEAAQLLETYVEYRPRDAEARFWLGEMHAEAGAHNTAIEQYRAALDIDPLRADAVERIRYLTESRRTARLAEHGTVQ